MARGTKRQLLDPTRMTLKKHVLAGRMPTYYVTHLQSNPGWFAINVLVPVLLPFAVIAAVAVATDGWRAFIHMIQKSVDGGQLFWVSLGMLASTGYDAFTGYTSRPEQQEFAAWAMGLCIGGAFFCAIFIAISTSRTSQQQRIPIAVIWLSALAVVLMCYCYPLVHFRLA